MPPPNATKALTALVWMGILATGAVGGIVTSAALTPEPAHTVPRTKDIGSTDAIAAAGWATSYLTAWLSAGEGDQDTLRRFTGADVDLGGIDPDSARADAVWPLSTTRTPSGAWSVLLAARLHWLPAGKPRDGGMHYFRVAVRVSGSSCTTLGTPIEVTAPSAPTPPPLGYSETDVADDGPLGDTVTEFLSSYLTGRGDVTRYSSPGTRFTPVVPPPATAVELTRLDRTELPGDDEDEEERVPADGTRVHVFATVTVTGDAKLRLLPSYPLLLTARAGRWEVSAIEPAPLTEPAAPSTSPTPAAPTTSGTTPTTAIPAPTDTAPPGE